MGREKVHLYHGSKAILRLRRNVDMVQRKVLAGCTMDLAKLAADLRPLGTKPMVQEMKVVLCTMLFGFLVMDDWFRKPAGMVQETEVAGCTMFL